VRRYHGRSSAVADAAGAAGLLLCRRVDGHQVRPCASIEELCSLS